MKLSTGNAYSTGAAVLVTVLLPFASASPIGRYNVIWNKPSEDASGEMPLGNGDIAAGVYAIQDGDLYLLLAKNDAMNYNGDIFKTGRVRISFRPNPFAEGSPFRQTLDLPTGSVVIQAGKVTLRIWADANRPVYHVQIESPEQLQVTARPDLWTRIDGCAWNCTSDPIDPPTQDVLLERNGHILWYFSVGDRSVFPTEMQFYEVPEMISLATDPYRFNTFGNLLDSPDLSLVDGSLVGSGNSFDIRIHALTAQTPDVNDWIAEIEGQASQPIDVQHDWQKHCRWWSDFWAKSWIIASDNTLPPELREQLDGEGYTSHRNDADGGALVAQSYNVFRFLMACQSRGKIQTKFNGGLFTQPLRYSRKPRLVAIERDDGTWLSHEDDRLWGRRFTYQNQRLLYWPLLMSGDFDLMKPFFDYYWNLLPIRKAITKAWFGHEGAYYRENIEPTGGERDCGKRGTDIEAKPRKTPPGANDGNAYYHSYYFTSGLETLAMMIDYARFTEDRKFRDDVLVPFAREVLLFFDKHYERDEHGKLRLDPSQVLETWWIAVNPAPDVSGLQFCLDGLLATKAGSPEDQQNWQRFRTEIPEVYLQDIGGQKAIAPARVWDRRRNSENGELYPVFPFRCFGLGLGTQGIVDWTMQHRTNKNAFGYKCWTQDQIHWAYAGNAVEAMEGLVHRFRHASPLCRFPLYGTEGPDSCPDFDHFGSGSIALQRMLVQEAGGKILLLPAWPADWDVDFQLHLSQNTVIRGKVVDGELEQWDIEPESRRSDVIVLPPQAVPTRPVIPANDHPLRLGTDHNGGSRFRGQLGRATVFNGRLTATRISELAAGDRSQKLAGDDVIACRLNAAAGDVLVDDIDEFQKTLSLEAWIKPASKESGRIFDKITAGTGDGFLIDCWPELSLRVIVGAHQVSSTGVLRPDVWQHLAVVITKENTEIFLDGKRIR